jgi:hypothetical protein
VCTALLVSLNGLERPIELQRSEGEVGTHPLGMLPRSEVFDVATSRS